MKISKLIVGVKVVSLTGYPFAGFVDAEPVKCVGCGCHGKYNVRIKKLDGIITFVTSDLLIPFKPMF